MAPAYPGKAGAKNMLGIHDTIHRIGSHSSYIYNWNTGNQSQDRLNIYKASLPNFFYNNRSFSSTARNKSTMAYSTDHVRIMQLTCII